MKLTKILTAAALLMTGALSAAGIGINLGPFNLQLEAGGRLPSELKIVLDSPVCYAIGNQKRLEIIVETTENRNSNEIFVEVKKLIVEPYAFGITREGRPIISGIVVESKKLKEVTVVKYDADEEEEDPEVVEYFKHKKKGFFSGWFTSDKSQTIDLNKVRNIHVIENSHFDAPKNYKGLNDENVRVICQLPVYR